MGICGWVCFCIDVERASKQGRLVGPGFRYALLRQPRRHLGHLAAAAVLAEDFGGLGGKIIKFAD
jgi:hypothetical protein